MVIAMSWLVLLSGCGVEGPGGFPRLPRAPAGWAVEGEDQVYDRDTLYGYIDGAAEVYLAYGFRRALTRRLVSPQEPSIVLDVFDMGSSEDAYGVFTFERMGPHAEVGQDSEYSSGLLRFWKGRFFVAVTAERETPASRVAVMELGQAVAAAVQEWGERPALLAALPAEGLDRLTVRFLHLRSSLNYHCYLSDENLLNLGPETDVVLARYGRGPEGRRLLVVEYPGEEAAEAARQAFLRGYLSGADAEGLALTEKRKWCGVRAVGERVILVLDAADREAARGLMEAALSRLETR